MFHKFFNPTHGNCFTFNSGMEKEEKNLLKSYKSGRQFGKHTKLSMLCVICQSAQLSLPVIGTDRYNKVWVFGQKYAVKLQ